MPSLVGSEMCIRDRVLTGQQESPLFVPCCPFWLSGVPLRNTWQCRSSAALLQQQYIWAHEQETQPSTTTAVTFPGDDFDYWNHASRFDDLRYYFEVRSIILVQQQQCNSSNSFLMIHLYFQVRHVLCIQSEWSSCLQQYKKYRAPIVIRNMTAGSG